VAILAPNLGVTQTDSRTLSNSPPRSPEASADVDPNNFNEDFEPLEHDDSRETMFNTLPELKMIHHNLGL
jgi:hypothetical protein